MKRTTLSVTMTVAVAAIALAGCGKSAEDTATTAPSPVASSPAVEASPSEAPSPSPSPLADQVINITYAGGKVSGVGAVVKVKKNSTVALVVTSDTADEIHLHGYDKSVDVDKGGTATLLFKATLPGKWEVELEKLKHRLVFLQVQ